MNTRGVLAATAAAALAALPSPAGSADLTVTVEPERVTVTPTTGAVQVVHLDGTGKGAPVEFWFQPARPPAFSTSMLSRRDLDRCTRTRVDGIEHWTCDGYGDLTITYPPIDPDVVAYPYGSVELSARVPGVRAAHGWVDVVMVEPSPSPEPSPSADSEPSGSQQPPASPSPDPSPSLEPEPSPSASPSAENVVLVADEDAGGGLPAEVVGWVGGAGLLALALGVAGLWGWRRRDGTTTS